MFHWMEALVQGNVGQAVLAICIVAAIGLGVGSIGLRGVRLGTAGVLFVGIFCGQLGMQIDERILEFVRDFGLILFVYTIGLQVGPGFFSSLKSQGLQLNALAAGVVLLGGLIAASLRLVFRFSIPAVAGIFSGATTNTPSLAAAQAVLQNLKDQPSSNADLLGMAYAVAYPFGIIGIILTMLLIKRVFHIDAETDRIDDRAVKDSEDRTPDYVDLEVTNPNVDGVGVGNLPLASEMGIVFSRLYRDGVVNVPSDDSVIHTGDIVRLVGPKAKLAEFEKVIGRRSALDLRSVPSQVTTEHLYVTKGTVIGKSLSDLHFDHSYGVVVTRVTRAEVEFAARDNVRLQFGDLLFVVGSKSGVMKVADLVGNKPKALDHPHVLPVFVGILLGVILGSAPIVLPGIPVPVRLGLAGGPLVVALVLSQIGRAGPLIWYLSPGANFVLRELGIVLFLACVGLKSGRRFMEVLISGNGVYWMVAGAVLTLVPLLLAGLLARVVLRLNFSTICGVLAGSMTDPPALAFAGTITKSDQPLR
jgi:putative transport protein